MDWQPIETAPKDGSWIELWRTPSSSDGIYWQPLITGRWWSWDDGDEPESAWVWPDDIFDVWTPLGVDRCEASIRNGDYGAARDVDFTHWRPLTNPPELGPQS